MENRFLLRITTREMTLAAIFTALTIIGAKINLLFPVVPVTLQPVIVLLAGCLTGKRTAMLSQIAYLILGLLGIPVFAKPSAGPGYMLQPSFGYLLGFVAAAYIVGALIEKFPVKNSIAFLLSGLAGIIVIYFFGLLYFYLLLNFILAKSVGIWDTFIKTGFFITIPKDISMAVLISVLVKSVYPRVRAAVK